MSDSDDDDLEDAPAFIKNASPSKTVPQSSSSSPEKEPSTSSSHSGPNKLDLLLSEQRKENAEEEYLRKTKLELLKNISEGSQEGSGHNDVTCDSLAEEHASHIEQLELKTSELLHVQPGVLLFHPDKYCCEFDESITPSQCGFISSGSSVDSLLASLTSERLCTVLLSKVLVTCFNRVSHSNVVMQWLFLLMSVHRSPVVKQFCCNNLMDILQQTKNQPMSPQGVLVQTWCPTVLLLLKLLVNLGADANTLLGHQTLYSAAEVSQTLISEKSDVKGEHIQQSGSFCPENLGLVLNVLAVSLQSRPSLSKEELHIMFYMVAKTSLDPALQNCLQRELQVCFSSILECFSDADWPSVIPELCRNLSSISSHHHDQAYLVELLTSGLRGEELQTRLAYVFLCLQLAPDDGDMPPSELPKVKLTDIAWLGRTPDLKQPSTLTTSILQLVNDDLYRVSSLLRLLDLCVGNERNRAAKPKEELQYLLGQVKLIIKGIRDNILQQDLSKIKDILSRMKVKWSLTLHNQRSVQRSVFAWATATTHQPVLEERLRNRIVSTEIDEDVDEL